MVSVVIPVYNAAAFIVASVDSVLEFTCVKEILLIEDGSTDNSIEICAELEKAHDKVRLFTHPENANLGAAKSRNLGIKRSTAPYIAFLDADDYYLSNRFDLEKKVLPSSKYNCVCGWTGCSFTSKEAQEEYQGNYNIGLNYEGEPEDLWQYQSPTGHSGTFTTNAITVSRNLLNEIGGFDERLRVSQDTELWIRLGLFGSIYPNPSTKPVAMRNVYVGNRSRLNDSIKKARPLVYSYLIENVLEKNVETKKIAVYSAFFIIHYLKALLSDYVYSSDEKKHMDSGLLSALWRILGSMPFVLIFFLMKRSRTVAR